MKKPREQKRSSDEAVKAKSGKNWAEWFKILDKAGAEKWEHKEIALFLYEKQKVAPWWSQVISVAYEHDRGIRDKFQKCDGQFSASASRTANVPIAKLYEFWAEENLRCKWLPEAEMEVTSMTKEKYFRAKWEDGASRLSVGFYPKGPQKALVTVDHEKLADAGECAKMKSYWFEALNRLQKTLEV